MRSRVATTRGRVVILSSPYDESGALYDLQRRHFGKDSATLVVQASAPVLNPTLPADYLAKMEADDPEAYRSEVLGEFRAGLSTLFDPTALADCVDNGVRERSPSPGVRYFAGFDPTGGRNDLWGLGIAHGDGGRAVLNVARGWRASSPWATSPPCSGSRRSPSTGGRRPTPRCRRRRSGVPCASSAPASIGGSPPGRRGARLRVMCFHRRNQGLLGATAALCRRVCRRAPARAIRI